MNETAGEAADPTPQPPTPAPIHADTGRLIEVGLVLWVVALVVILAVPALRTGERDWWPWVPVAALALGLFGRFYVRRGRGNAAEA